MLYKLLRITVLCFKFVSRLRRTHDSSSITLISSANLIKDKIFWIKATQSVIFSSEISTIRRNSGFKSSHAFCRLTAFMDSEGVIRVGGRLGNSQVTYEETHPAIIPHSSRLTDLIIEEAHRATLHGGTQLTLSRIRRCYWIIDGRAPVRSFVLQCVGCARQRGIRAYQMMDQLPHSRVTPARPFAHTGVDYARPNTIKAWKGRGAKTHKGWICVFVCFATSALHIEAVRE